MPQNNQISLKAGNLLEEGRKNPYLKNYFYSLSQYDIVSTFWYNESPAEVINSSPVNTSSIQTSQIDQFRQGVEITQNKHTIGNVKIYAGTPGHFVKPLCYGISGNEILGLNSCVELDNFDAVTYVSSQENALYPEEVLTFPIVLNGNDEVDFSFNGIIEPFTIRNVADFKSTDFPYELRTYRGSLESGNANPFYLSNDQVLSIDYWEIRDNASWYLDSYSVIDPSGSYFQPIPYVNGDLNKISTFDDAKVYIKTFGISEISMGADMLNAILAMSSSTSNYVPPGKKSATSGFVFDNTGYAGIDSIAFGGMTY
jgi:hypothetical protein